MRRWARVLLGGVGLSAAVCSTASLTGGWLGTPPWWEREVSIEEYVESRYGVSLASPTHPDPVLVERQGREWISGAVAAVGLALFAWAAWPRRGKPARGGADGNAKTVPVSFPESVASAPWHPYNSGSAIGETGSEGGVILLDHEHEEGARITLEVVERPGITHAITCGIYGWMVHTRYFDDGGDARRSFDEMKLGLEQIVAAIPMKDDPRVQQLSDDVAGQIRGFIERFP